MVDFNVSAPWIRFGNGRRLRLWNAFFHRPYRGDRWWGFGLLQVGRRHLLYVGFQGFRALFLGQTP